MPASIDPKIREEIIADYAVSNSVNAVCKKYGVSWATVRKIVGDAEAQINKLREEKQKKYINDAWEVVSAYLAKLMDPKTIKEAKARDCSAVIIGMLERIQRQQELNQRFDIMYDNIVHEHSEWFKSAVQNDKVLLSEVRRFLDEGYEETNKKQKGIIREKINKKTLMLRDITNEYGQNEKNKKEKLAALFDEVKAEILDEIYKEDDPDDE